MKRRIFLLIGLIINSTLLFSQGIYFKAASNYNFSISTQQMPEYFSYLILVPGTDGLRELKINLIDDEFSIASGLNFQGSVGYSLNDYISVELRFSTFGNAKKVFEASPALEYTNNGTTEWNYKNYSLLPTILFGQAFNKSAVNIFVNSGIGISTLNIKASSEISFREYEFERCYTFFWGYGLEYDYFLSENFMLFTNIGITNTNYKAEKAKLKYSSSEFIPNRQDEIRYVDEITNLKLNHHNATDPDQPELRLKETLKLNSAFLGIGIKYALKK
ncbi:MAG: porin family protein [Cyclobacteriaceae bacterium]|nr:porin family protein [Cyclobacteriaceae bacterium]